MAVTGIRHVSGSQGNETETVTFETGTGIETETKIEIGIFHSLPSAIVTGTEKEIEIVGWVTVTVTVTEITANPATEIESETVTETIQHAPLEVASIATVLATTPGTAATAPVLAPVTFTARVPALEVAPEITLTALVIVLDPETVPEHIAATKIDQEKETGHATETVIVIVTVTMERKTLPLVDRKAFTCMLFVLS